MNDFSSSDFESFHSAGWWVLLFIKSCVALLAALGFEQIFKKRISTAAKHTVLVCGFFGLLSILVGSVIAETTRVKITLPIFESREEAKTPSNISVSSNPPPRSAPDSDQKRKTDKTIIPKQYPASKSNREMQREAAESTGTAGKSFSFQSAHLSMIWLFGSAFFLTFQTIAYAVAIRRVLSNSSDANASLHDELIHLKREIGVSKSIRFRVSKRRTAPLLFGVLSPSVIVPNSFEFMEAKDRRMILAHELQHIQRNDVAVRHFVRFVCSLFWFNPLTWYVSRRVIHLQELACDEAVLKSTGEASTDYADLLVHIAKNSRESYQRTGISMAGSSQLSARINAVLTHDALPTRAKTLLHFSLLAVCTISLSTGLTQITQADGKIQLDSSSSASSGSANLTDREQQHLVEIHKMFARGEVFPSGLHYEGSVRKSEWRDSSEKLETHPLETRFSVWLGGNWDSLKYRADFTPNVTMWVSGAAPWSIRDETHFTGPDGKKGSIRHSDIGRRTPNSYRTGIENLPGIFAILSTANRHNIEATLEEGRRNSLFREIAARLDSKVRDYGTTTLKIFEDGDTFPGEAIVELNLTREGREDTWWFDPERDYAVRGWLREDTRKRAPRFRNRLHVSDLVSLGENRWFPKRAEASLESNRNGGDSMDYYWRYEYLFDSVQILDQVDDSIFTLEGIESSISNLPSSAEEEIVGGTIVNEEGLAVEGAKIDLSVSTSIGRRKSVLSETDKNGKWSATLTRPYLDEFYIRLSHPDYVTDRYSQDYRERASQPYSALYDQTSKIEIKRGMTFPGRVIDHKANPVANAEIVMVRDRWGANIPDVRSDSDGYFTMPAFDLDKLSSSQIYLTVQAENHGPALRTLSSESLSSGTPLVVALPPPSVLQLRIVDETGQPIKGALVVADSWREQTRTLVFEQRTNSDGRVQWDNAPNSVVSFDILGPDVTLRDCSVEPSEGPVDIVLRPAFTIQGNVFDEKNGTPVESFRVTLGRKTSASDREPYWEENLATSHKNGTFSREGSHLGFLYSFRIEAEGYQSFTTKEFKADRNDEQVKIILKRR